MVADSLNRYYSYSPEFVAVANPVKRVLHRFAHGNEIGIQIDYGPHGTLR